jgi:hypothetical protein
VFYSSSADEKPRHHNAASPTSARLSLPDAAPWLLLASSLLLYFAYHPYAQICRAFLDGGPAAPSLQSFMSAMMVPYAIPDNFDFLHDAVSQWSALTAALCLLLVLFLSRLVFHRRSQPPA